MEPDLPLHLYVREWTALSSAAAMLCVIITVGLALFPRLARPGWRERPWVRGAIGWTMLTLGGIVRLEWVWPLLRSYTMPGWFTDIGDWWAVDLVGGALTIVGAVCVVREYAPDDLGPLWSRRAVVFTVAVTLAGHYPELILWGGRLWALLRLAVGAG